MLKLSKKIALPLIAVLLIGTGVGGYFLFKNFQTSRYFVDKYSDLLEYCDTEKEGNNLKVSCKALILDIKPNVSEGTPSLTSLITTNSEELQEYTVSEKEEVFTWTNDVLQFKKLKPVIINLLYVKKNPINFSLQGITFEDIPETYIQEIVNRDIEEIMGMDKSSTTILNSFDFCPRPETLPDYVTSKEEYIKYWDENILSRKEYKNKENFSLEDIVIRILFSCDSQVNLGYISQCPTSDITFTNRLKTKLRNSDPIPPRIGSETDQEFLPQIKQISLLYDGTELILSRFMPLLQVGEDFAWLNDSSDVLQTIVDTYSASKNISEETFCTMAKLLRNYDNISEVHTYLEKMSTIFVDNIAQFASSICMETFNSEAVDSLGWYLKNSQEKNSNNTALVNRCINLQKYLK